MVPHLPLNYCAYLILQYYFKVIMYLNQYFISHVPQPKFEVAILLNFSLISNLFILQEQSTYGGGWNSIRTTKKDQSSR